MAFKLKNTSGQARRGELATPHGTVQTPFFMTIGTAGAIKGLIPKEVGNFGGQVILSNTYHLHLRPGEDTVQKAGGLHKFMNWDGPILTDSGGYQVFSLAKMRKLTEEGVKFRSHIDGNPVFLTPEKSIEIQHKLGSDIIMVLDECPAADAKKDYVKRSLGLTTRWAKRCKEFHEKSGSDSLLFGIVQGGMHAELRAESADQLKEIGFDGYAIGGLSVGEPSEVMYKMIEATAPHLPEDKPRYLMGVGTPLDLLEAVERGIDMFDCVLPTRNARHGFLYTHDGIVRIKNAKYKEDFTALDEEVECYTSKECTKAYMHHLMKAGEPLYLRLATEHNVAFYLKLMADIRAAIEEDRFAAFKAEFIKRFKV